MVFTCPYCIGVFIIVRGMGEWEWWWLLAPLHNAVEQRQLATSWWHLWALHISSPNAWGLPNGRPQQGWQGGWRWRWRWRYELASVVLLWGWWWGKRVPSISKEIIFSRCHDVHRLWCNEFCACILLGKNCTRMGWWLHVWCDMHVNATLSVFVSVDF